MPEGDSAFLWETEALRSLSTAAVERARAAQPAQRAPTPAGSDWVTLREANRATGIPVSTLRKWARREAVPSYLQATATGELRMVSLAAVTERADELGRDTSPVPRATPTAPARPAEPETPPGTMLVPIDAWDKMLLQLGNLHEAGQQLAEARERAAKAETEATFLRERLAELKADLAEARIREPAAPQPPPGTEREPIAHIPIESDEPPSPPPAGGDEIAVRNLEPTSRREPAPVKDENEMSLAEYSLEVVKHIYSTWRGRPRR